MGSDVHQSVIGVDQKDALLGPREQPLAALENLLENRRRVGHRTADDLQHFGGGGLPLQRLLRLVQQPHVLDRDDRLISEGLEQVDLALRRGTRTRPGNHDGADRGAVLEQRGAEHAAPAASVGRGLVVIGVEEGVLLDLDVAAEDHAAAHHLRVGWRGVQPPGVHHGGGRPVARGHKMHQLAIEAQHSRQRLAEEACCAFEDRLEDRRHVQWRFADHPQHLADRGLVFERFGQFGRSLGQLALQACGETDVAQRHGRLRGQHRQPVAVDLCETAEGAFDVRVEVAQQLVLRDQRCDEATAPHCRLGAFGSMAQTARPGYARRFEPGRDGFQQWRCLLIAPQQRVRAAQAGRRFQDQQHALRAEQRRHFLDQECVQFVLGAQAVQAQSGVRRCYRRTRLHPNDAPARGFVFVLEVRYELRV